ncbi:fungal hydrophobin-domain-containing protein [Flagelloscypha sp. PMI_526]|nr:fungal hydrophobin-domain-containing protein [Flagelloscypha sp. PMI_526]
MKSFTTIVFATLFAVAVNAMPTVEAIERRGGSSPAHSDQCNTGPVQCCKSVTTADDENASKIIHSLNVQDIVGNSAVGLNCSPLSVIGISGNSCSAQPVCCSNNNFNGVIAIGCTPINVNV